MKVLLFFFLTLICVIIGTSQATNLKSKYPPILNYYPSCSYKIIKNYIVKNKTDDPSKKHIITNKLLLKIRKRANDVGADAVILIAKNIKRTISAAKVAIFTMKFEAELIKQCDEDIDYSQKLTAFNHLGEKVIRTTLTSKIKSTTYSYAFTNSGAIHRPKIINKEVSLENGVYGIKLGRNYQYIINILGTPNTEMNIFTDELIIGYGRRHWFHFQNNKLVKIQTSSPLLSQNMINKIPFIDFFDDFQWKINNKISYKTQLSELNKTLNITENPNKKHRLVFSNSTSKLTLLFNKYKDESKQGVRYTLNGFSLEKITYKQPKNHLTVDGEKHFNILKKAMATLNEGQALNFKTLETNLGKALGSITLSKREQIIIYNNNLFLQIKSDRIKNIALVEDLFLTGKLQSNTVPWYLGEFKQDNSIELLRKYFPIDSFELDNKVEIDSDKYQLSLFFDEVSDKTLLYEAKLTLY